MQVTQKDFDANGSALGLSAALMLELAQYYFEGRKPQGHWLQSVLGGNLIGASKGSPIEMSQFAGLADFISMYWDVAAIGTPQVVDNWCRRGGLLGHQARMKAAGRGPDPDRQWLIKFLVLPVRKWRPDAWPYPGPFWGSALASEARLHNQPDDFVKEFMEDYPNSRLVRCIFPEDVPHLRVWPSCREMWSEPRYVAAEAFEEWYPAPYPCPLWWDRSQNIAIGSEPTDL